MKMENPKTKNIQMFLAIAIIVLALFNILIISDFKKEVTGFATGYVNLTVVTQVSLNVTNGSIMFGTGAVSSGFNRSNLTTVQGGNASIINGNWTGANATGILLQNTGNINITLTIQSTMNASDLFGNVTDTPVKPYYQFNVTEKEQGSCTKGEAKNTLININKSAILICGQFSSISSNDEIWLDVHLSVPNDGLTGYLIDTMTITAAVA